MVVGVKWHFATCPWLRCFLRKQGSAIVKRRINHFAPGVLGKYTGHSIVDEDGTVRHYANDGSLIDGVLGGRYVGKSVIQADTTESQNYGDRSGGTGGGSGVGGLGLVLMGMVILAIPMLVLGALGYGDSAALLVLAAIAWVIIKIPTLLFWAFVVWIAWKVFMAIAKTLAGIGKFVDDRIEKK
jgi:hypothetical protein